MEMKITKNPYPVNKATTKIASKRNILARLSDEMISSHASYFFPQLTVKGIIDACEEGWIVLTFQRDTANGLDWGSGLKFWQDL